MFKGPFFHDEMTALAASEHSNADWLNTMVRNASEPLTVEVSPEDMLKWMGIDAKAMAVLIGRVTEELSATTSRGTPGAQAAVTGSPGDWKAFRYRTELTAYAMAGCTLTPNGPGGVTVTRPEGMSIDEFRELTLRVTTW